MTDLKELRDLHNARSRFYDPLTASSFEVACIEALPALLDVAEAAEALSYEANHAPDWPTEMGWSVEQAWKDRYAAAFKAMTAALARLTEGK